MAVNKENLEALRIERKPDAERSPWSWVVVLVVLGLAFVALLWWWFKPAAVAEVRTVLARELQGGTTGTVLNASGYVTARRQATVSSKVTGKVMEVLIEEGMEVARGQILARLDDANVRVSFELAEARLASARSALKETEALLVEARINLKRTKQLVDQRVASQAELDNIRAETASLEARLNRQRADVQVAHRQVEVWRQQLQDTIIRAPFAGIVVAKNAQPGEMISPLSAGGGFTRTGIGTIVDMSSLEIEVDVNEAYINRVTPEQSVQATLDAYPDWKIPCRVIAIIPTADRQKATVTVRVGFEALDPRMLPDMGVKVAFQEAGEVDRDKAGVVVPPSAVRRREGRDIVLVVDNGRVEHRAVSVGQRRGSDVLLAAGLTAGELVVVEGPADIADGDRVKEKDR
jgi:RND family efflux transporter MFP subunit